MFEKIKSFLEYFKNKVEIFGPFSVKLLLGLIFGFIAFVIFIDISEDIWFNEVMVFDNIVTSIVRYNISDEITFLMAFISDLASPVIISLIILTILFCYAYNRNWLSLAQVLVVTLGSVSLNQLLKVVFKRQRPTIPHLVEAFGLSYPSGHSMVSFSFYGLLMYLCWTNIKNKYIRVFSTIFFGLLIFSIGLSRIYLGVHYPSDVLAGFAAGCFWLIFCIYGFKAYKNIKDCKVNK